VEVIFEGKIGKGKILICGVDLINDLDNRPEARQLLYSIRKYMVSEAFNPVYSMENNDMLDLFISI